MLLILLLLLTSCHPQTQPPGVDGVYTMCKEVRGFSGENLELKDGKFRYWFYSDAKTGDEPEYPLSGSYTVDGSTLTLDNPKIHSPKRTFATVNGVRVLWRKDGLELWEKDKRLHPYAILLPVEGATEFSDRLERPSLELLKTPDMKDREKKEYEERFGDLEPESRALFRARSQEGDRNMDAYKAAIGQARVQPDPKLVRQLIGILGDRSKSIQATSILGDLYGTSWLIKEPPPFSLDPSARKKALETLIDAVSAAQDRRCLEGALLAFLRASDTRKIDLAVPETGITIKISIQGKDAYSLASEGTPVDDIWWKKRIDKLIPACQEWMRANLPK
jgi:hypothetical protein